MRVAQAVKEVVPPPAAAGVLHLDERESLAVQRQALESIDRLMGLFPSQEGQKIDIMLASTHEGGCEAAVRVLQALGGRTHSRLTEEEYWECAEWIGQYIHVKAYFKRSAQAGDRSISYWERS